MWPGKQRAKEIAGETVPAVTIESQTAPEGEPSTHDPTEPTPSDLAESSPTQELPTAAPAPEHPDGFSDKPDEQQTRLMPPAPIPHAQSEHQTADAPGDQTVSTQTKPPGPSATAAIEPLIIGNESTFHKAPWWSQNNWTKLTNAGQPSDVTSQIGTAGPIALISTSIRGRKHRLTGQPNQDSCATVTIRGDDDQDTFVIAAVCDGMGSAQHSEHGARAGALITTALLENCLLTWADNDLRRLKEGLIGGQTALLQDLTDVITSFLNRPMPNWLQDAALQPPAGAILEDLQTTLTCAIVDLRPDAETLPGLLITVGDSPAFILGVDGPTPIDPEKDADGLWSSATDGLLGATKWTVTDIVLTQAQPLLICSDGLGNFLSHPSGPTTLGEYITTKWSQPIHQLDFIRDLSFDMTSADDDRTALVIWNRDQ